MERPSCKDPRKDRKMKFNVISAPAMVKESGVKVTSPREAFTAVTALMEKMAEEIGGTDQELFIAVPLNTVNEAGAPILISMGGQNFASVDQRILFRRLLLAGAANFIIVHNHPSGSMTFSQEDIALTKEIREGANILGMKLFDHLLITSERSWFSYSEQVGPLH